MGEKIFYFFCAFSFAIGFMASVALMVGVAKKERWLSMIVLSIFALAGVVVAAVAAGVFLGVWVSLSGVSSALAGKGVL